MPKGLVTVSYYPDYIDDEFLELLGNILEGQTGPHIDDAEKKISEYMLVNYLDSAMTQVLRKALRVIARDRASSS
jgi:hypothetical protein